MKASASTPHSHRVRDGLRNPPTRDVVTCGPTIGRAPQPSPHQAGRGIDALNTSSLDAFTRLSFNETPRSTYQTRGP